MQCLYIDANRVVVWYVCLEELANKREQIERYRLEYSNIKGRFKIQIQNLNDQDKLQRIDDGEEIDEKEFNDLQNLTQGKLGSMKLTGTINGDAEQSRFGKSVLDNKFVDQRQQELQMEKEKEEKEKDTSKVSVRFFSSPLDLIY